jgi:hypothetical protein
MHNGEFVFVCIYVRNYSVDLDEFGIVVYTEICRKNLILARICSLRPLPIDTDC